jgi:PPOX class probable F420-dependent enzyme
VIDESQRAFLNDQRVARLATADAAGQPYVVPVCFALEEGNVYITVDEKPKTTSARPLKRLRNILENPAVALVVDRYDEDWNRLGWVMVRGPAEVLDSGPEHDTVQKALKDRYPQLRQMDLAPLPVIAIRIARVTSWGNLEI